MKKIAILLLMAFCYALIVMLSPAIVSNQEIVRKEVFESSPVINSDDCHNAKFTIVNLFQFAKGDPYDPKIGLSTRIAAIGKNASINVTQMVPGHKIGKHYHAYRDEIDYVLEGLANQTIGNHYYMIGEGDLVYIPSNTIHDVEAVGTEDFKAICIFSPPYDGKDRIFV
jgi:mannose-6-phosphate isomerase-like protein (cupin superfamily)